MTDFCHQCYGRRYVHIDGRRVTCTCVALAPFDDLRRGRAIACEECGDAEAGPWLVRDGRVLCEQCDGAKAAS